MLRRRTTHIYLAGDEAHVNLRVHKFLHPTFWLALWHEKTSPEVQIKLRKDTILRNGEGAARGGGAWWSLAACAVQETISVKASTWPAWAHAIWAMRNKHVLRPQKWYA